MSPINLSTTVILLSAFSTTQAVLQITQPAPLASTLPLHPLPSLRWVYTSSDPGVVGIRVTQSPSDIPYDPTLILYRKGTPVAWAEVELQLDMTKFTPGMNVTIAITDPASSDNSLEQNALDSVGPLKLVEGEEGIAPQGSSSTVTGMASSSATSSAPSAEDSLPASSVKSTNATSSTSTSTATITATDEATTSTTEEASTSTTDEASASSTSSSSDADKTQIVTALYITFLIVSAIPAFLMGVNP
jgi:hypothetical protein